MFEGGLARRAPLRRGLHLQTLQGDRLAAIRTVAVAPGIETLQSRFHLGHFVEIALLLHAAKVRQQALRRLVLAVRHLMR